MPKPNSQPRLSRSAWKPRRKSSNLPLILGIAAPAVIGIVCLAVFIPWGGSADLGEVPVAASGPIGASSSNGGDAARLGTLPDAASNPIDASSSNDGDAEAILALLEQQIALDREMADLLAAIHTQNDITAAIPQFRDIEERRAKLEVKLDPLKQRSPQAYLAAAPQVARQAGDQEVRISQEKRRISAVLGDALDRVLSEIQGRRAAQRMIAKHEALKDETDTKGYRAVHEDTALEVGMRVQVLERFAQSWQNGTVVEVAKNGKVKVHLDQFGGQGVFDKFHDRSTLRIPDDPPPTPPGAGLADIVVPYDPLTDPFHPGNVPTAPPTESFGPDVIVVLVEGNLDDGTWLKWQVELMRLLIEATMNRKYVAHTVNGRKWMVLGSLEDLQGFAGRIKFAELVSVDEKTRQIHIREK